MKEQTTEYKSNIEQLVNAIKEGFKSQRDFLAKILKGTNQVQQNQVQQMHAQVHQSQAQPSPLYYTQNYTQNFPQLIPPTNPHQLTKILGNPI